MNGKTLLKMTLSALVLILAVISAAVGRNPYAILAVPGMLLGFHGDLCLAKAPFVQRLYREPFLVGASSFLIGHLFYIAAFLSAGPVSAGAFWGAFLVLVVLTLALWVLAMSRAKGRSTALRAGLLLYALVIGAMASTGFALAIAQGGVFWLAMLGGLLFIVSDGLIALGDFLGMKIPNHDTLIWATYVPAQLCIVLVGFFI